MANRKHPVNEEQILNLAKLLTELEQEDMYSELGLTNAQIAKILAKRSGYTNVSADVVGRIRNKDYVCLRPAPEPEPEPEPESETIDATNAIEEEKWQGIIIRAINVILKVQNEVIESQTSCLHANTEMVGCMKNMITTMKNLLCKIDALDGKMDQVSYLVAKFYTDCGGNLGAEG